MQETQVESLGQTHPLKKEMPTHSNIPAWEIPLTEEPGKLQSTGSQIVRHDLVTAAAAAAKSLQSCPTLCDPTDGSLPGSPVHHDNCI